MFVFALHKKFLLWFYYTIGVCFCDCLFLLQLCNFYYLIHRHTIFETLIFRESMILIYEKYIEIVVSLLSDYYDAHSIVSIVVKLTVSADVKRFPLTAYIIPSIITARSKADVSEPSGESISPHRLN